MKITELEIMLETISQPQPGMGPLPDIWEDWLKRHLGCAINDVKAAMDQVYTSGYNHGLAVGQEQRILNNKLDEEL
jgi:hypothetical protein